MVGNIMVKIIKWTDFDYNPYWSYLFRRMFWNIRFMCKCDSYARIGRYRFFIYRSGGFVFWKIKVGHTVFIHQACWSEFHAKRDCQENWEKLFEIVNFH